jgi:hypothetical protein
MAFVSLASIAGPLDEPPVSTQAAKASGSKAANRILGVFRLCILIVPTPFYVLFLWSRSVERLAMVGTFGRTAR